MNLPLTKMEILTLGRFSISVDGKPAAPDWPNESVKDFFCSLLSPLDLYITRDRLCRSMWGIPETADSRRRLEETVIRPLSLFLVDEFGFNPLSEKPEGIRLSLQQIRLDAFEFYHTALDGLRLLSIGCHAAALEKIRVANLLYAGSYLPGIPGKITAKTRAELDIMYQATCDHALHAAERAILLSGLKHEE